MAYKLFASGDVLTASDVNSYIMKQTVMVFADASARTTALSGVLAAGMVSYLTGTNSLETYNGSAWTANGTGDVATTGTQTLTNKTLTSPVITQGTSTPSFTTNAYTLVAGDAGQFLLASNSTTAGTINIPTDATYAFANGTQIHIQQTGTGQLTIQATTSGTTTVVSTGLSSIAPKIRAQYSVATIMKTSTNNWTVFGDIA